MEQFRPRLQQAADRLELQLSREQQDKLLAYLDLFARWNAAYNLSAVRNPSEMLERHIIDSLSVVNLCGTSADDLSPLIDVGSGGGLPGIPLAIVHPDRPVSLLDSNGKKSRFQFQVASQLKLANINVVNERVEAYQPEKPYAGVVSRAFASLRDMVVGSEHLLSPGGRFYAMKGKIPEDELSALPKGIKVEQLHTLRVPGCDAERHLIVLAREE
ncbi:16S rRNA (guanine(527)-N(7))-methyltransferase RsmG [Microbulbifer hydrolyticus]|uniref:Ribosomal RNA small subunit methyltransferase G n=1 Tax=Microbulbifer hydrolyticus TaxID=48074 RepID=A0A6P1T762_9GAMM|nr:16S rRNA (guanine(527)-N(7))-methyltransferase RsmG [Microbulbifer hydrolyticus]MBB5211755.1 16S rRNA (guanine527-N7)-methyltransferase [Microbulbifer hydrolyticus]QHQ37520.1 16S rRNA (guanine(527)-N(7))-methyltransferase RsmG [Microbulbifer hydrolyticus]